MKRHGRECTTTNQCKSIFETHYKSAIVITSFFVTTWGWFAWLSFLDVVYASGPEGPYNIRRTFTQHFGRDPRWWSAVFVVLAFLGVLQVAGKTIRRNMLIADAWHWPPWKRRRHSDHLEERDLQVWQELEQNPRVRERLRRLANDEFAVQDMEEEDVFDLEVRMDG